jgi:Trehalose utilisation
MKQGPLRLSRSKPRFLFWHALVCALLILGPGTGLTGSKVPDESAQKLRLLIATGGHEFEEDAFFKMFDTMAGISWTHVRFNQGAEEKLGLAAAREYDVALFYDMHQDPEPHRNSWLKVLEQGKATVFLHHALGSYVRWKGYGEIVGGRANFGKEVVEGVPNSSFKHDVNFRVHIADKEHPITRGLQDFDIFDETYDHFTVNTDVHVLLTVNHPDSGKVIAWTHKYRNSPIVYLQLGHGPSAYENPNFRKLVERSLRWVASEMTSR